MKTKGRPKSKNVVNRNSFMSNVEAFLAESLAMAYKAPTVKIPRKRPNGPK